MHLPMLPVRSRVSNLAFNLITLSICWKRYTSSTTASYASQTLRKASGHLGAAAWELAASRCLVALNGIFLSS